MNGSRRIASAVLAVLLVCSSPLFASGGGGGGSEEDGGDTMTYVTIGLVVVVGGLLFLDVLSGSDEEEIPSQEELLVAEQTSTDTGIDWSSEFPDRQDAFFVAVSVLEGEDRAGSAARLVQAIVSEAPEGLTVFGDPLDLGPVSPLDAARMADEYFGADYLVYLLDTPGDSLVFGVATSDSILWTSRWSDDILFTVPAEQMMEAGIFGNR